jgi:sec-independent protein translocase protein TatA
MFGLTPAHLIIILVIALIVVGPGKLPEVGSAIGKSIREFQKAVGPIQDATNPAAAAVPTTPAPAPVYYAVQPGYPVSMPQAPMQYQPVMGVVESAPAQPAPIATPQPDTAQPVSPSPKAD